MRFLLSLACLVALTCHARADFAAYVSSLTEDAVVRLVDLNGDGDLNDAGESAVFFGPGNADGWPGVSSAQTLLALGYDDILAADGEESGGFATRVYRLRDLNGDGDAMDLGEATEFWDSVLPIGVNFDRPKDMLIGPDGAIYLADNNTINFDYDTPEAVWRLEDLNGDGDVSDDGEVTLYIELSPPDSHFGFISEDFKFDSQGRLFFSNQNSSSNHGMVWIIEPDLSLTEYANDDDILGIALDRPGMTLHPVSENPVLAGYDVADNRRILELVDDNGNGIIDDVDELRSLYRDDAAVEFVTWGIPNHAMDVDYAPDGSLWLLDNVGKAIVHFVDVTGDGDYLDANEAAVIYEADVAGVNGGFAMDFPRTVVFAEEPACTGDLDGDGDTDQADLGILLAAYGTSGGGDLDGDGDTDQADLGVLLADYGCGT